MEPDPLAVEKGNPTLIIQPPQRATLSESERLSQIPFQVFRGHKDAVNCCHFCFDDSKLISCSNDKTVQLWDISRCSSVHVFGDEHKASISECNLTLDNKRMVTSSYDKTVKLWDMESGQVIWSACMEGLINSCSVSYNGKLIVCCLDIENSLCIIDSATASRVVYINDHHSSTITKCRFDPEIERVCSVSSDRSIKLWDMKAQRTTINITKAHSNVISDCEFSSNGHILCTTSWDKSLKLWNINAGDFRLGGPGVLQKAHKGSVSACVISKDMSVVVSGGYDKSIVLWDMNAASKKHILKGHEDWVMDVSISANKKWIVSSSKDSTLRLWNIENCEKIPTVIENNRAMGSRIFQCEDCAKPFSVMNWDNPNTSKCVFCRLASPFTTTFPLPPTPDPVP
ncbi:hypothetical protein GDO86_008186 [Hymenochirus boettgeri]|uniref:Uncharacterized protein n=1 Tax=Hymenochirus boettgeri TaxID=247094 RepID=A0A8T2J3Y6_9PIPI|nr:hypothetical protein GDO86_008186 [Hymenochirus boettgeri]